MAESTSVHENNQNAETSSAIATKIALCKKILGKNFDAAAFFNDVEEYKKTGKDINNIDISKYKKESSLPDANYGNYGSNDLSFTANFVDGKFEAISPDGQKVIGKNLDDLNLKLAQTFKQKALQEGKEPRVSFEYGKQDNTLSKQEMTESFARNFINEGVTVKGDLPTDSKFWQKLKQDYLADKKNTLDNWNKLTRFVPPEYMGKSAEKQASEQENSKNEKTKTFPQSRNVIKHIFCLSRKGYNPKLNPPRRNQKVHPSNIDYSKMRPSNHDR